MTQVVAWAAGNGDRSENADYQYGKRRLREIDRRIRFLSKRIDAAEVVDPATPQARTYLIKTSAKLWTGQFLGNPTANTVTLGPLRPLRPGPHVVEVYWLFSAMHCDGLGIDPALQCLPAGETLIGTLSFKVTTPAS